jgi:Flp pilus assembly protein TadG
MPPRNNILTLRNDRRAAAAAEMALLLPVLLGMMFGVVQLGFAGFTYSTMLNAARTGARQVTFGSVGPGAVTAVRNQLPPWIRSQATVTVTDNVGGMARVQVSAPGSAASLIPFLPIPMPITVDITMPRVADR